METKNYYISDKDFVTGYLVGRIEAHSDENLSDDGIEEFADMVYEDENLGIDRARAIMDDYGYIYIGNKDKPNTDLSYEEIVNNVLFKTGYIVGNIESNNEVNQSKNDSNYETLMKSVRRDTAAKMRSITEGFSLSKDTDVAGQKVKSINPDFTLIKDACDEDVNHYLKEYEKSCKLDEDDDEACDCENCEDCEGSVHQTMSYDEFKHLIDGDDEHSVLEFNYDVLEDVKKVIFSGKATIIIWEDGTKTVVKCQKGDKYDPEKGLVMALLKGLMGNDNTFNDVINELMEKAIFSKNEKKVKLSKKKPCYYATDNEVKKSE